MKTMLDKCVAIGDVTKAHDVTGIETLGVIVAGLSTGTACDIVTSDTENGTFTKLYELVSSTLASSTYNNGFVISLTGAKKFFKVTGASLAVGFIGDADHDIKKADYKDVSVSGGEVDVEALNVTANGTYTADTGKAYNPVTVNVPTGGSGIQKLYCFLSDGNYVVYTSKPISELTTSDKALWVDNRDDTNNHFLPITEVNEGSIRVDWTGVSDINDNPMYWNGNTIEFSNF